MIRKQDLQSYNKKLDQELKAKEFKYNQKNQLI